jgi:DNA polymerase III subunit beta
MQHESIDIATATPLGARFTVERAPLLNAVAFMAKRIVERRNTIPILSNIAFSVDAGAVRLSCTDLDIQAVTVLQCDVEAPGAFTLDAGTLHELLKKVAADSLVTLAFDDGRVNVHAGRIRSRLAALPIDDFPVIAHPIGVDCHRFTLSAEYARDLAALVPAISKEESRYYLNGVAMEVSAGRLHMVATDGVTLAMVDREAPSGLAELASSIIPRKAIAALLAATGKAPAPLSVEIGPRFVSFDLGGMTITAKLIDGTFPDWRKAVALGLGDDPLEACAIPFMHDRLALDAIAKLEKAAGTPLSVDIGEKSALLSSANYPEFCAVSWLTPASANAKGFTRQRDEQEELRAIDYLTDLAARAGLSTDFLDEHGARAVRSHWATGEAESRMIGVTFGRIVEPAKCEFSQREVVDYETFTTRYEQIKIETPAIWQDGAYSVAMPVEALFDHRNATLSVQGDDGTYSDAQWLAQDKRGAVSLSADHIAMLCGPVDPASFVHIPTVVFHRGEAVSIDGVATPAMPDGWTVNAMPPTGKEAKALRARMVTLARIDCPNAARELREIAGRFDAIHPMRDYEIDGNPIAVDVTPPVAECEADLTTVTASESETAVMQGKSLESLPCPTPVAELVAIEPVDSHRLQNTSPDETATALYAKHGVDVRPIDPATPSAELADWQAFMAARFGALEARLERLEIESTKTADQHPILPEKPANAGLDGVDQIATASPPIGAKERTPDAPAMAGSGLFRVCNGQSAKRAFGRGSDSDWGICLAWDYDHLCGWWRAETSNGRRMVYKTMEQAEAARLILEEKGWPQKLTERGIACPVALPKKERTPAHVRAIMTYLKSRKVRSERDKIMAALNKSSEHRATLRKSRDDWEGLQARTYAKRRRAVLAAREFQKRAQHYYANWKHEQRLFGEYAAEAVERFEAEALRTRVAETALTAVQARVDGWPPAVRSVSVQYGRAA